MSLLDPSMEDLPVEAMVDILSKLPVKMIIQCKCVCKKWQNIVLDSYFADIQLSRSPAGFIICHIFSKLEYHNYEKEELDHHRLHLDPIMSLDLNLAPIFQNSQIFPVGSVNGLVCLWQYGHGKDNTSICNPMTREYIFLARLEYYSGSRVLSIHCFGFGSLTREYKVLRIFQGKIPPKLKSQPTLVEANVYTLGMGQWRSIGHVPYQIRGPTGPFLNGHAHWIVIDKDSPEKICAFDFDKETFELFPSPPSEAIGHRWIFQSLGVLKGCLCLCDRYDNKLTVWVMKEYGIKKSWHKELVIKESIIPNLDALTLTPVYIIVGFEDGTILMGYNGDTRALFVYCPRRKTIVDTQIFNHQIKGYAYRPSFHRLQNFENERVDEF